VIAIGRTRRAALAATGLVLLLALAAPVAAYAFPSLAGADEGLVVLSGSMEPAIEPGDIVLVEDVPIEEIEPGDVVTFQSHPGSETTYTHRVVDVTTDKRGTVLTTKGDANEQLDPMQTDADMLVGRVDHTIPKLGKLVAALQGPIAPLGLVGLSLVTIGHEVHRWTHREADDEDTRSFPVVDHQRRFPVVNRR